MRKNREDMERGLDSLLPPTIVSQVVENDRVRSGRSPEAPAPAPSEEESSSDIMTSHRHDIMTSHTAETSEELLARRIEEASKLAKSPTKTVTLRLPVELTEWLDDYVHGTWREGSRKQKLVTEALRMLYARRGKPGEPALLTDLLPEEEVFE